MLRFIIIVITISYFHTYVGFKKILGKVAGKIEDKAGDIKEARQERRKQHEIEEAEFRKEEQKITDLLDKFEIPDFEKLFDKVIGSQPSLAYDIDKDTGKEVLKRPLRREYLDFVLDNIHDEELSYQQLKDFAIRHKIIPPSFFGEDSDVVGNINDFENIINSIHRGFDPERITNEEHLQSQLTVFLKAKFPDMKVEREVKTKQGDLLDIVVDDKYVFELKVPKNRTQLRNLSAQVEEYIEQYPNLCVVIADISKADLEEELESNLTQNITEYTDKYKVKFGVQTLIFNIQTRK